MHIKDEHFLISDTHFWHKNIIAYCDRPWNNGKDGDGNYIISDDNVKKMNDDLVYRWNSVVGENDIVWHLGDFAFFGKSRIDDAIKLIKRLNGTKLLVMGNHDFHVNKSTSFWRDIGFSEVYDHPILVDKLVWLSHEPLLFMKKDCPFANIYGHVHNSELYKTFTENTCCVCVEHWNYTPVTYSAIKAGMRTEMER